MDIHVNRNSYEQEIRIIFKKIKKWRLSRDWYPYNKIPSI